MERATQGRRSDDLAGAMRLWAKTRAAAPDASVPAAYHPLPCHLIDVAYVAAGLWRGSLSAAARAGLARTFGIDEESAGKWIAFLAGLHDLGKASPVFQRKDALAKERISEAGFPWPRRIETAEDIPHGVITTFTLNSLLASEFHLEGAIARVLAAAVGGHHGTFPTSAATNEPRKHPEEAGSGPWETVRRGIVIELAEALGLQSARTISGSAFAREINAAAMVIAGLTSVADWIGSNSGYFPPAAEEPDFIPPRIEDYLPRARDAAELALKELGWLGWAPSSQPYGFHDLFPLSDQPRPLQRTAEIIAKEVDGPGLVIIEAPMGEGKTEAAMLFSAMWERRGERGCYFALPTMATSDQMFGRVLGFLSHRYPGQRVNFQLLHGHAALSAEFELLRRHSGAVFTTSETCDGDVSDVDEADVAAASWFTYRKRGLLAPFGVGTVDQVLMAALQTKHVFVRLFGLSHKVVIVDEVHAYETYMTVLLERLLEWLGALGAPAVLLSATLPRSRRQRLVDAYARGLGLASQPQLPDVSYPRISWLTRSRADARTFETSAQARKTVRLRWVDGAVPTSEGGPFPLADALAEALRDGGCTAVVCNTVGRAQEVYKALKVRFPGNADDGKPTVDLLHARYLYKDRAEREARVLERFSKPGGTVTRPDGTKVEVRRPDKAILVATQVIEQSLDLDFDLMVSDFAPSDLMLQRVGRLHRHERPPRPVGVATPCLWIVQPKVENAVPQFEDHADRIYDPHIRLRSWLDMSRRSDIVIPDQVEEIVEAVYAEAASCPADASNTLRARWEETASELREQIAADASEAKDRWLKSPAYDGAFWHFTLDPREEDAPEFHAAHQALTRLAEPSVQVVCLYQRNGTPVLSTDDPTPINLGRVPAPAEARELLKASVSIQDRRVIHALWAQEPPASWRRSPLLRHNRLVLLDDHGEATVGERTLRLDPEMGVTVT